MHMFSPRNVYRNMWELCDAYLRLRLMQTWWHRPHQMCQMKIQFERIEKPYSKILIPIYIYICSEDLKSYPSQCSTIMVCILLHLSSVSQQPWEATFQHQVRKNWPFEPVFFPAVCAWQATKYTLFFFATPKKLGLLSFPPLGKRSEYQLFLSISWPITFGVETRDRRIVELRTLRRSRPVANLFIRSLLVEGFSCHFVLEELAYQVNDCVFS